MSDAFVNQLRTRGGVIDVASPGGPAITVRVEMPEVWDVVRVRTSPDERILLVKLRALEALNPGSEPHEEYVLKLHGWEVLDEGATIASTGAVDGSIYLLTHRRRRAVR
jgi:hypothetical protein